MADLEDSAYASGRLGVMAIAAIGDGGMVDFADVEVEGAEVRPSDWKALAEPAPHRIEPCPETDPESCRSYPNVVKSRSGELTVSVPFGDPDQGELRRTGWVRSADAGRTWSDPETSAPSSSDSIPATLR